VTGGAELMGLAVAAVGPAALAAIGDVLQVEVVAAFRFRNAEVGHDRTPLIAMGFDLAEQLLGDHMGHLVGDGFGGESLGLSAGNIEVIANNALASVAHYLPGCSAAEVETDFGTGFAFFTGLAEQRLRQREVSFGGRGQLRYQLLFTQGFAPWLRRGNQYPCGRRRHPTLWSLPGCRHSVAPR